MKRNNPYARTRDLRKLSLMQAAILIFNMARAVRNPNVGWEDQFNGITEVKAYMRRGKIEIKTGLIESLLWACNLLNERKEFIHPEGGDFITFANSFAKRGEVFDRLYNVFERKA